MKDEVYEPSEDSFLMENNLPLDLKGKSVLEIGCGSGILSVACAVKGVFVTSVDININALNATERLAVLNNVKVELIKSNLFENVAGKFDLILFNPPYVASGKEGLKGESAWSGGVKGRKVIDLFLKEFKNFLNKKGVCLLLVSSVNEIKSELEDNNWKEVDFLKLDDEILYVMRFELK